MRAFSRVQDLLHPPQPQVSSSDVNDAQLGLSGSVAVAVDGPDCRPTGLQCPGVFGRCASQLGRRVKGKRRESSGSTGHQQPPRPGGTSASDEENHGSALLSSCGRLVDRMCNGVRHLVTTASETARQRNADEPPRCHSARCKWCKTGCTRIYLIIVNLTSFIGGWSLIALAVWIHINADSFFLSPILRDNPTGPVIVIDQIPIILAIVGLLFAVTSFLGCCGACADSVCFLGFYTVFLIGVIVSEVAVGVLTTALSQQITDSLRASMHYQITREYNKTAKQINLTTSDTLEITQSWDVLQSKFNCCGVDGPGDYMHSAWYNHTKDLAGTFVPTSCCTPVLRKSHVYAINENFCQVNALLWPRSLNESQFLNTRGCHRSLVVWSDSYLQRVVGLPLSLVILTQIVSLVLACVLVKWVRRKQSDYWWYVTEECE